jgi:hypothetical protein
MYLDLIAWLFKTPKFDEKNLAGNWLNSGFSGKVVFENSWI